MLHLHDSIHFSSSHLLPACLGPAHMCGKDIIKFMTIARVNRASHDHLAKQDMPKERCQNPAAFCPAAASLASPAACCSAVFRASTVMPAHAHRADVCFQFEFLFCMQPPALSAPMLMEQHGRALRILSTVESQLYYWTPMQIMSQMNDEHMTRHASTPCPDRLTSAAWALRRRPGGSTVYAGCSR